MKKLLAMVLIFMFVVMCSACSSTSNTPTKEKDSTPTIEYYPDSNVPTLECLLHENLIQGGGGLGYVYGPYETENEAKSVMSSYANVLTSEYGFEITENTYYYGLTNGTDEVKIILGSKDGKDAVGVSVN